jgi:EAL domain-containing protein (putative c-di-GMP-specific phosphodiesterase class I)/CheY-like chemotaxis protein
LISTLSRLTCQSTWKDFSITAKKGLQLCPRLVILSVVSKIRVFNFGKPMKKILVIEDDNLVRSNILELLNGEGYETIGAENGVEGLNLVRGFTPDLIICDIMMPQLDGYGVLTQLRQDPMMSIIPFIFLTAKAGKAELRQGMTSGADDYVIKPFTRTELLSAIRARLAKQEALVISLSQPKPRSPEQADMLARMRRALENNEFRLFYHPIVDLKTGKTRAAEALIRWFPPEGKMIPPGDFIPLAEESGFISEMGNWILHTATAQMHHWRAKNLPVKQVAVNLSARQFEEPDLADKVIKALNNFGLEPDAMELELTETTLMRNPDEAVETINNLKVLGFEISIDDFGVGFSSFGQLNRFPFDKLKIDRSFVSNVSDTAQNGTIVSAIIQMAHSLGLKTVAEGVETEAELAFLRQHNCDYMQGYYFAKPLPAPDFEHLVANGKSL